IYVKNAESIQKIEIVNILGQNVKIFNVVNNSHDVSDLAGGIYIIRMHSDGDVFVKSLIKK
ncbi:MAG: T9SS type A sorting domain-containing protein, partial [Bacteroidales bacterium]|nr:T9SS type A sorting domain-containing protein [Bacteroidales bacterium]